MKQSSKLFFAIMAGMLSLSFASCDHSSDDAPSFGIDPILVDFTNSGCKEYLETGDDRNVIDFVITKLLLGIVFNVSNESLRFTN